MSVHEPVLTAEALTFLAPERGGLFVDCTVGLGGHTRALLEAGARLIGGRSAAGDARALRGIPMIGGCHGHIPGTRPDAISSRLGRWSG